ncbi:hypothetical protein PFICI_09532 [Pestalotiopsis fici W106-1]|uniref:amidase n=1 Tax=Pestalotiopsis fici (strain W106-1 / CGMCC3.15140) TaxID=1229662 RepID=W3X0V9_PESFW|nr:uncharacterized protein PFICI_09532 [Pestalotiopsis fici W106-1]ETS79679.1 hypothetical protein PFICI_09532 [Pestalotiopsis fici W106-1]
MDYKVKAAEKCSATYAAIPEEWRLSPECLSLLQQPVEKCRNNLFEPDFIQSSGILSPKEREITENYEVSRLLGALAGGTLSAVEVTVAFSKRAAIAQQLILFDQALERARDLDALRSSGNLAGPLHGLPISIKDSFQVKGTQATIGLVSYLDRVSDVNSVLVDVLLQLGAVLYLKTNVPQTMMTADSHNNIFGRVLNPWNTMLTAGGSSGGEGALVGFRGSPLGVGTDVGGSIRIPSLCCGTYGFKPTAGRIPYGQQVGCSDPGLRMILAAAGPIANDIDALEIFVKAVVNARPALLDHTAIDVPWKEMKLATDHKLRLGLLAEDPLYPLHPPVQAALDKAVNILREHGHKIIEITPVEGHVADSAEVAWNLWGLDATADEIVKAGGEPAVPSRLSLARDAAATNWSFVPDLSQLPALKKLSFLNIKRSEIAANWNRTWRVHNLDAVIGPPAQHTAVEHDNYGIPAYTVLLNLLDYPACVLPFSHASSSTTPRSFEKKPGQAGPPYHPSVVEGAPCSIQIFTRKMCDEQCLAVAAIIDKALNL